MNEWVNASKGSGDRTDNRDIISNIYSSASGLSRIRSFTCRVSYSQTHSLTLSRKKVEKPSNDYARGFELGMQHI